MGGGKKRGRRKKGGNFIFHHLISQLNSTNLLNMTVSAKKTFTIKYTFWVWPKITTRNMQDQYSVNSIGIIHGVMATLCCSTKG